jgi:Ni,Fe-hydrogenase III small subunit/NAD-dependent dihydropyrimidine dehydrogenase PreA subunit
MSILSALRVRRSQGSQFIRDVRVAVPKGLRGLPVLGPAPCTAGCTRCRDACPARAITVEPLTLDLGRCVFCGACAEECPESTIVMSSEPKMASQHRDDLILRQQTERARLRANEGFSKLFGRSLRMRQVSAGGCNACELELNATTNVNFDAQRFGIEWVASPRHADALVLTGPLTKNMRDAVRLSWEAMPQPAFLVAVGACAISGGLYEEGAELDRAFLEDVAPVLYVPGCPPHPLTFLNALLDFLGIA